mgnify:CR=1 FL=1
MAELLLNNLKIDINHQSKDQKYSLLQIAVKKENLKICQLLLSNNIDVNICSVIKQIILMKFSFQIIKYYEFLHLMKFFKKFLSRTTNNNGC